MGTEERRGPSLSPSTLLQEEAKRRRRRGGWSKGGRGDGQRVQSRGSLGEDEGQMLGGGMPAACPRRLGNREVGAEERIARLSSLQRQAWKLFMVIISGDSSGLLLFFFVHF